jgi:hypothetical protein
LEYYIPFLNSSFEEFGGSKRERLQVPGNPRHQTGLCLDIILFAAHKINGGSIYADKTID